MKARIAILPLFLAACCVAGHAQAVKPSITIGTRVLTLGMPENSVLEQLGAGFRVYPIGKSPGVVWLVQGFGREHEVVGEVAFSANHLSYAARTWQVEENSSKSLFNAIHSAEKDLELEGLTACQLSAKDEGRGVSVAEVILDCGVRRIEITSVALGAPKPRSNTDEAVFESIGAFH